MSPRGEGRTDDAPGRLGAATFPAALAESVRRIAARPSGAIGLSLVLFWVVVAVLAPVIAPFGPFQQIKPFQLPGARAADGQVFWLGTDALGRDIASRIIAGSRTVLFYAPLATACAYTLGCTMGVVAGYLRGWWDAGLSFVANVILAFPVFVLYVVVIATTGASALNIVIAITFASAPGIMRIVRGLVLDLRSRDFVAAALIRGEGDLWIMFREILPNAVGPLVVDACLRLGYVTIIIGVLGFLGLGLPPPSPDWGGMVNEGRSMALLYPHVMIFPCLAISSLVLGFNLIADAAQDGRE